MKVNIIIIGAKNSTSSHLNIDSINNYKKWNNPDQADYFDMIDCVKLLQSKFQAKVSVFCLDPLYDFVAQNDNIAYINECFTVGDAKYCTKKGHNIFIEFANLLDEYYITKEYDEKIANISKYNAYRTTWISCGCSWSRKFPTELILNIVDNHLYTPTDIYDANSFLAVYNFNALNENPLYAPYTQALYQILGSLLWRGSKENHKYETVLYDFLPQIMHIFHISVQDELSKFLKKEIRWNYLHRTTRELVNRVVYGEYITIY
jgi:hypothetical protein